MIYLCILSIVISTTALICSLSNNEHTRNMSTFLVFLSFLCIFIVYDKFDEPQKLKEKCVKLGIGKFVADDKANVKFYFINHKNEMIEYGRKQENK
jgi:hypothetical protein